MNRSDGVKHYSRRWPHLPLSSLLDMHTQEVWSFTFSQLLTGHGCNYWSMSIILIVRKALHPYSMTKYRVLLLRKMRCSMEIL